MPSVFLKNVFLNIPRWFNEYVATEAAPSDIQNKTGR